MNSLLGVDGSKASHVAAALVANLAWPRAARSTVLTAHTGAATLFASGDWLGPGPDRPGRERHRGRGAQPRRAVAKRLARPTIKVQPRVVRDRAASAILDRAAEFEADLIVVGNRGRGPFESASSGRSRRGRGPQHPPRARGLS